MTKALVGGNLKIIFVMMYKSQKSIMDQGIPEMPMGSKKVSELPGPVVQVGNTSVIGVLSFPKDKKVIIVWYEMFGGDKTFKGFDEEEVMLNSIIEKSNAN